MEKSLYNKFKQDLGISDAANEYIEVLLRQFESAPNDESSFQVMASHYGIRVNDVEPQTAINKIREYYIITVFQVFEDFLSQMHSYLKDYGKYNSNRDSSDSILKHIHKNLIGMKRTTEISYLNYLICDYYRLIRNLCAHTDNAKKVLSAYQILLERKEEIEAIYPQLQAPNDFQNISFDDYVLYSRAAKNLAEEYVFNIKYDIEKFASKFDLDRFRLYRNNPKRLRAKLEWDLKVNYSIKSENIEMIVDKLVEKNIKSTHDLFIYWLGYPPPKAHYLV